MLQAGLPFLCHVLAADTPVVMVIAALVVVGSVVIVIVTIVAGRIRIVARSRTVSVVRRQWAGRTAVGIVRAVVACRQVIVLVGYATAIRIVSTVVLRVFVIPVSVAGAVVVTRIVLACTTERCCSECGAAG